MTERTDLNHIKGKYAQSYGHEIDDWSALLLSEVEQHFERLRADVNKSVNVIDNAAAAIKGNQNQVRFADGKQSFYYGLALSLPWSVVAFILSACIVWLFTVGEEYQVRRRIINAYKNAPDYEILMQNGEIVSEQGGNYLRLLPRKGKGDVLIGREYILDGKTKEVLVPLGRD